MFTTAINEKGTVVYIHDDYCSHVEATEVTNILLKISELISGAYRHASQGNDEH